MNAPTVGAIVDTSRPVDRTGNQFCGPLVVAAVLGTSTGVVAERIAAARKRVGGTLLASGKVKRVRARTAEAIRGTYQDELFSVLAQDGVTLEWHDVGARYVRMRKARGRDVYVNDSFTRWNTLEPLFSAEPWYPCTILDRECLPLWRAALRMQSGTYIVHLPGHWAIASDGKWCETYTRGEWVALSRAPSNRRKVLKAWRVVRRESVL